MGSPPLYPQFDDEGPATHAAPSTGAAQTNPTPTDAARAPAGLSPGATTSAEPSGPASTLDPGRDKTDELLAVIGGLGAQLEAFKKLRAEHEAEAKRLAELQRELDAEAERQNERKAKLAAAHAAIKAHQERLEQRESELDQRAAELDSRLAEFEARQTELDSRLAELAERQAEADALAQQSRALIERATAELAELAAQRQQISERESLARSMQEAARDQLDAAAIDLAHAHSADDWKRQAEANLAEAGAARRELEQANERLTEQLEASRRDEHASRTEWENLSEETALLRKKLDAAERDAERLRQSSLTAERVQELVDEAVASARQAWDAERAAAASAERDRSSQAIAGLESQAAEASQALAAERARAKQLEEQLASAERALQKSKEEASRAAAQLEAQAAAATAGTDEERERARGAIAALEAQAAEASRALAAERERSQQLQERLDATEHAFQRLKEEAVQAVRAAKDAERAAVERVASPEGSSPAAHGAPPDWEKQIRKRDQAIRALKEHLEAAEARALERDQLFQLREQLNAERDQIKTLARVTQRKAARSSAALATLFLMVALAIAAGGAWLAAGRFAPPIYLAEATIAPDKREGTLNPGHVESWTLYHQALLGDPVFIERAAERLAARGFTDMGTPAQLRQAMDQRLNVIHASDGGLTFSLRGEGSTSTERALDIIVGTLINQANAARDLRLDRTSSVMAAPATSGDRPIADPRLRLFSVIFGCLAAAALIAFGFVTRWLAAAPINTGDAVLDLSDSTVGFDQHLQDTIVDDDDLDLTRSGV